MSLLSETAWSELEFVAALESEHSFMQNAPIRDNADAEQPTKLSMI